MIIELSDNEIQIILLALNNQRRVISFHRHSNWESALTSARELEKKIEMRWKMGVTNVS